MRRPLVLLALSAGLACSVAACSGSSGSPSGPAPSSRPSASSSAPAQRTTPPTTRPAAPTTSGTGSRTGSDPVPRGKPQFTLDLARRSPSNPAQLKAGGHAFDVYNSTANTSGLKLSSAGMTHGAPTALNGASYLETKLAAPPQYMQADVVFGGGAKSGAFTLVDWLRSIKAQHAVPGGQPSQGSFHVTFTPRFVHIGVYQQSVHQVAIVGATTFAHPLAADGRTVQHITLTRRGDRVTITVPGNPPITARSELFTRQQGDWACWELYEQGPGFVPAHITSIGAGT